MKAISKKSRGQPSLEIADREALLWMVEIWRAGTSGLSVTKISRIAVGLEAISPYEDPRISSQEDLKAKKPKPSSDTFQRVLFVPPSRTAQTVLWLLVFAFLVHILDNHADWYASDD